MADQLLHHVQGRSRLRAQAYKGMPKAMKPNPDNRSSAMSFTDILCRLDAAVLKQLLNAARYPTWVLSMQCLLIGEKETLAAVLFQFSQQLGN